MYTYRSGVVTQLKVSVTASLSALYNFAKGLVFPRWLVLSLSSNDLSVALGNMHSSSRMDKIPIGCNETTIVIRVMSHFSKSSIDAVSSTAMLILLRESYHIAVTN